MVANVPNPVTRDDLAGVLNLKAPADPLKKDLRKVLRDGIADLFDDDSDVGVVCGQVIEKINEILHKECKR